MKLQIAEMVSAAKATPGPSPCTFRVADLEPHRTIMADLICDVAIIGDGTPARRVRRWTCTKALIEDSKLPKAAQEVAILVTGALFNSRYKLYDAYDISMPEREEKLPSG